MVLTALLQHSLRQPGRVDCHRYLSTAINKQLRENADPPSIPIRPITRKHHLPADDPTTILAARTSTKLEDGNFRGAVRLACSDDTLAPMNEATFEALQEQHPPPASDSSIPPFVVTAQQCTIFVTKEEVIRAICSFSKGSAVTPYLCDIDLIDLGKAVLKLDVWNLGMPLTLFKWKQCFMLFWNMRLPSTLLSTQSTPHHPLSSGVTVSSNLQKECSSGIPWSPPRSPCWDHQLEMFLYLSHLHDQDQHAEEDG